MNKTNEAIKEIDSINDLTLVKSFFRDLHPLVKLLMTFFYLVCVISRNKYDLAGTIVLIVYPLFIYSLAHIPISTCFYKLRYVLPFVMMVGIFNPFLDKTIIYSLGGIRGGVVSMLTLMLKGILCLMASFILIATTPIEEICYALRLIRFPKFLVSLLLLTYRYVAVLLEEVDIMLTSYRLRAPNQKGIHISSWGSFLGQLILRTVDRANSLYESMELRGFNGEFYYVSNKYNVRKSLMFLFLVFIVLLLLTMFNMIVFMIGELFI